MNGSVPLEIEKKYIILIPDLEKLSRLDGYTKSDIIQTYLTSSKGVTHRVRRRAYADRVVYTETKKIRIDAVSSFEDEREISEACFSELSRNIREGSHPVIKTRHTFVLGEQTYEIDVYPEWKDTAIMETELKSREAIADIPSFIEIVKDVTGDHRYSNSAMSHAFPEESV